MAAKRLPVASRRARRSTHGALAIACCYACCLLAGRSAPKAFLQVEAPRRIALAQLLATAVTGGSAQAATGEPAIDMYFGQGSFWRVQSDFTALETKVLGRSGTAVTSISGYAGGQPVNNQLVCYHNLEFPRRDYSILGHAEAVEVASIPADKIGTFAKAFLDAVPVPAAESDSDRRGEQGDGDQGGGRGPEFRAILGLPGGSESPYFKDILDANGGRLKLAVGKGSDPSTAGTDVVWIYDSAKFPFYQAELYHQFHDQDASKKSPERYKALKGALLRRGRLQPVSCPESEITESGAVDEVEDSMNFGGSGSDPFEPILGFGKPDAPTPPNMNRVQKNFLES